MMPAKFLVVSTAVTDDILFPDGTVKKGVAGGAGIYALAGIKLWTDEVMIVTGVGKDYSSLHGAWFADNGLSHSGLTVKGDVTPRTTIQYFENGEREETPVYGLEHYQLMEPSPAEVARHCRAAEGVYVFKNANEAFWEKMIQLKETYGFKLMWEIAADAAIPEKVDVVTAIAGRTDVFSINRQEASTLFAVNRKEDIICRLQTMNIPLVFLRMGQEGAYMITRENVCNVPAVNLTQVIDATGGGNSSSGAVLYGYCRGEDPLKSGIMGSISAAYCIAQFGPPPRLDQTLRHETQRIAEKAYKKYFEAQYEKQ